MGDETGGGGASSPPACPRYTVKKYSDQNPARTRTTPEYTVIAGFLSGGPWSGILLDENPEIAGWSKKHPLYSFFCSSKWYNQLKNMKNYPAISV